jgi:hypothetical protein
MGARAKDIAMIELPHGFLSALFIALIVMVHVNNRGKHGFTRLPPSAPST